MLEVRMSDADRCLTYFFGTKIFAHMIGGISVIYTIDPVTENGSEHKLEGKQVSKEVNVEEPVNS